MKRLVELTVIDRETITYRLPAGQLESVFDDDVMLEASQYRVDAIDARLRLKAAPAATVRALMWFD